METQRWCGRFVGLTRRPLFTPKEIPWYLFLLGLSGPQGYRRIRLLENFPSTPRRIEPGTFRLVPQLTTLPLPSPLLL